MVSAGKQRCCRIKPPFRLHAGALYAEQGCNFCGWQRYERGELVDAVGGTGMVFPTDDDELPEVTAPEWIVDKVAHYGDEA